MYNFDENKEAINFLFEHEKRQEERYKAADKRIKLMLSEEMSEVRKNGYKPV